MAEQQNEPLLLNQEEVQQQRKYSDSDYFFFAGDRERINGFNDFFRQLTVESNKLWRLAGPAIFTSLCQYALGAITTTFAGHVGTLELAAVTIVNTAIAGFSNGIMLGMGSALETLCGQAFGAGQLDMLGVYLQRSWIILNTTGIVLCFIYIFAGRFLKLIGQSPQIATLAGRFAIWMIPQLFAYSMNYPIAKFLQAQSKMMVMTIITFVAMILHIFFSWLLMLKLGWGLVGAAVVLNASWWFIVVAQLVYIFSGTCGRAWSGFSWLAFSNLWAFIKLSLASAIMICLEVWYYMILVIVAGYLKNPAVSVDALAICMTILGWAIMIAVGANAAASVRVSNELGAGHPRTTIFAVVVVVATSFLIGLILSLILIIMRNLYPIAFTSNPDVRKLVSSLTPLLSLSIIVNSVQPVLSGVAVGAGWQAVVAYVNIGCYYIFGIPIGLILGFKINLGVVGIWLGLISGTVLQTIILIWMTCRTNWNEEAYAAMDRIKLWGGDTNNGIDGEE